MVLLGVFDGRGANPARILTWVAAGLAICVNIPAAAANLYRAFPWYHNLTLTVALTTIAVAITVIVLLALPASNAYFRWRWRPVRRPYPAPPYWYPRVR
jgi:hypothetical protein